MELEGVKVENFRSYRDSGWIPIDNKLVVVGENNAGKSNLLDAIDYFFSFRSSKPHEQSDFHFQDVSEPIKISARFSDFSADEKELFGEYIHEDVLEIRLELPYDEKKEEVDTRSYFVRRETLQQDDLRNIDNVSADEKVNRYEKHKSLLEPFKEQVKWTAKNGASVVRAVEAYRESDQAETKLSWVSPGITSDLDDTLPDVSLYRADRDLDDAARTSNKSSMMYRLLEAAVQEIPEEERAEISSDLDELEDEINSADTFQPLRELEESLSSKLSSQINHLTEINLETSLPDLSEIITRNSSVVVGDAYQDEVEDMGDGSKMSFYFACLWELTERDTDTMILGMEEPENDLHPHAQRQLYDTLSELVEQGHYVFLTTHSSELVKIGDVNDIVRISRDGSPAGRMKSASKVDSLGDDSLSEHQEEKLKTHATADKNEMFFSRSIIVCEGYSDKDVLDLFNAILAEQDPALSPFDSEGVTIINADGKENMSMYLEIASEFGIPTVSLMDDDRDGSDSDIQHQETIDEVRELSKESFLLEEDLEHALFSCVTLEEFNDAMLRLNEMDVIYGYDYSAEDIQRAIDEDGDKTKTEKLQYFFERYDPSKPIFGRELVKQFDEKSVPDDIEDVIRRSLELAS